MKAVGAPVVTYLPFVLLGVALLIALGFEFVNGFHDTANAVATVIYTHSLPANVAVVWSGFFNFLGVLFSTGAVAFGIVSLLPVELILQVGSSAGFAMVFALLIAAIVWNLRHLVARPSGLLVSHVHWVDHRSRRRQCADARSRRHIRRRLGKGHRNRLRATPLADRRLHGGGSATPARQIRRPQPGAIQGAGRSIAATVVDPRSSYSDLHRRFPGSAPLRQILD